MIATFSLNNINPLRRRISDWIPAPPTIMDVTEPSENFSNSESINHEKVLSALIPNTERGLLRSASIFDAEILGLRLTEENTSTVLRFIRGPSEDKQKSTVAARQLVNFLSRWDEFIALPEADLDFLEDTWTGVSMLRTERQQLPDQQHFTSWWNLLLSSTIPGISPRRSRIWLFQRQP
jgi:hypothetical protein